MKAKSIFIESRNGDVPWMLFLAVLDLTSERRVQYVVKRHQAQHFPVKESTFVLVNNSRNASSSG